MYNKSILITGGSYNAKKKTETTANEVKADDVTKTVKKKPIAETSAAVIAEKSVKNIAKSKTSAKATTVPKETVKIQFGSDEYDFAEIKKAVEADYKGKVKGKIKTVEIYIKPEDKAVYYVINSDFSDKIKL